MILQNAELPRTRTPPPAVASPAPAKRTAKEDAAERATAPLAAAATASAPPPTQTAAQTESALAATQVSAAPMTASPPKAEPLPLVPLKQDPPQLTGALLREQAEGVVKVAFAVKPDGSTGDVHVLTSSNRKLNNASMEAVTAWRFKPIGDTRPVEVELVFKKE